MQAWCAFGTTCLDSRRYVGIFLAFHGVRPQDAEEGGGHSSDMASDEWLEASNVDLHVALQTRIGGMARLEDDDDGDIVEVTEKVFHHRNSASGMDLE